MDPNADPNDIPSFRVPRPPLSAYQMWQLSKERRELRKSLLDRWEATAFQTGTGRPIDALICPVAPYAAVPHGQTRYLSKVSLLCKPDAMGDTGLLYTPSSGTRSTIPASSSQLPKSIRTSTAYLLGIHSGVKKMSIFIRCVSTVYRRSSRIVQ